MRTLTYPAESLFPSLGRDISILALGYADAEDLLQLRLVSRVANDYVPPVLSHRVRHVFTPAVVDYLAFASVMHISCSVISDIAALYILYPDTGAPPFATIYCPEETWQFLVYHLVDVQHFKVVPRPDDGRAFHRGIRFVVRLRKYEFMLDVVQSVTSSPLLPLTTQTNSALFNYVSSTWFSCAYPSLNRHRRALLNPYRLDGYRVIPADMASNIGIWKTNGWDIALQPSMLPHAGTCDGRSSAGCASAVRAFGDAHSLQGMVRLLHVLPLNVTQPPRIHAAAQ